eukprot:365313-Chlamydomonas_euryale.AAC.20
MPGCANIGRTKDDAACSDSLMGAWLCLTSTRHVQNDRPWQDVPQVNWSVCSWVGHPGHKQEVMPVADGSPVVTHAGTHPPLCQT